MPQLYLGLWKQLIYPIFIVTTKTLLLVHQDIQHKCTCKQHLPFGTLLRMNFHNQVDFILVKALLLHDLLNSAIDHNCDFRLEDWRTYWDSYHFLSIRLLIYVPWIDYSIIFLALPYVYRKTLLMIQINCNYLYNWMLVSINAMKNFPDFFVHQIEVRHFFVTRCHIFINFAV